MYLDNLPSAISVGYSRYLKWNTAAMLLSHCYVQRLCRHVISADATIALFHATQRLRDSPGNNIWIAPRRDVCVHVPDLMHNHCTQIVLWPRLSTILINQSGGQWIHVIACSQRFLLTSQWQFRVAWLPPCLVIANTVTGGCVCCSFSLHAHNLFVNYSGISKEKEWKVEQWKQWNEWKEWKQTLRI